MTGPTPECREPGCVFTPIIDGYCKRHVPSGPTIPDAAIEAFRTEVDKDGDFTPDADQTRRGLVAAYPHLAAEIGERIATAIENWRPNDNRAEEPGAWRRGVRHAKLAAARIARTSHQTEEQP